MFPLEQQNDSDQLSRKAPSSEGAFCCAFRIELQSTINTEETSEVLTAQLSVIRSLPTPQQRFKSTQQLGSEATSISHEATAFACRH